MKKPIRRAPLRAASLLKDYRDLWGDALARLKGLEWPSPEYADNPVGFVRDKLGESPLPHQIEILEAARDNFKVAVRSGQKTGKTKLVIWLALWWYCTRAAGRVFMLAAIKDQVQRVLWTELKATLKAGAKVGFELQEPVPANPSTGVIADGREIRGFTVRDIEALAGLSGDILFIVDEASHMLGPIAEAIEGNLAGGGKMVWISNPTRTDGPFYDVFNNPDKGKFWRTFHLSSETVAQWCLREGVEVKGVATVRIIAEWEEEWKRDSAFFIVRVLGEFLRNETGRINNLGDIEVSQAAWFEAADEGDTQIGVDPAGPGDGGDEYAFCVRRGKKIVWLESVAGLTEDAAIAKIRGLVSTFRRGNDIPWVVIDSAGPIGASLGGALHNISEALLAKRPADAFYLLGVHASHSARRQPLQYDRVREELWASGAAWLRDGGALLPDHKLATELHAPMWISTVGGKLKVTPKDELRDVLGRSTDRADAFLLAVWAPTSFAAETAHVAQPTSQGPAEYGIPRRALGPYDSGMGRGDAFDPYKRG